MEPNILEIQDPELGSIFIEIDKPNRANTRSSGSKGSQNNESSVIQKKMSGMMGSLPGIAKSVFNALDSVKPSEIEIEVGLKLKTGANIFVISAGSDIDLKVTLKWSEKKEESSKPK